MKKTLGSIFIISLFLFVLPLRNQTIATCKNWEQNCYACSCSSAGCNGSQLCYGEDDVSKQSCNVSQSCNTPTDKVYSCDCDGQVGDTFYTKVPSCGDPSIQCIGDLAPNGSGKTCHYCATTVSPTGIPPTPAPTKISAPTPTPWDGTVKVDVVERNGVNGSIVTRAENITSQLNQGTWGYYNVYAKEPNLPIYWCTYLIIDSYNQAGVPGLNRASHGSVAGMSLFWSRQNPGYTFLEYRKTNSREVLSQIYPGNAFFMESIPFTYTGSEHVAVIRSVDIDQQTGDGVIKTYESNTVATSLTYYIDEWRIRSATYPYVSFGLWQ